MWFGIFYDNERKPLVCNGELFCKKRSLEPLIILIDYIVKFVCMW